MLRPFLSVIKMLLALAVFFLSSAIHLPMILLVCLGWCIWLWFVVPAWKGRLLAALGLGLTALGWWCCFSLWHYFAIRVEVSHVREDADYWAGMATASTQVGFGVIVIALMLLAYADYLRVLKQASQPTDEVDQSHVWPPTPKQPQ